MADLTLMNSKSSWNLTKDLLRSDICGDHEHLLRANHDHLNHDHLTEGGLLTKMRPGFWYVVAGNVVIDSVAFSFY